MKLRVVRSNDVPVDNFQISLPLPVSIQVWYNGKWMPIKLDIATGGYLMFYVYINGKRKQLENVVEILECYLETEKSLRRYGKKSPKV